MIGEYLEHGTFFVAAIDGNRCETIEAFIIEIGKAFGFPDHYGENMNALYDCINDLSWITKDNYILIINNFGSFISGDPTDKADMISFLEKVSKEWSNVPNYEGEDHRNKSIFKVIYN